MMTNLTSLPPRTWDRDRATRALDGLVRIVEDIVPAVMLAVMTGTIALAVFSRYVLKAPIDFANELATVLFIWIVFLSAAGATRRREHVSIALLEDSLHGRAQHLHRLVVDVLGVIVVVSLGYLGVSFLEKVHRVFYTLGIGWEWAFSALPVGMLLIGLHLIRDAISQVKLLRGFDG